MDTVVFDIETNGLLDELDTVHSLVIRDLKTGEVMSCADQPGYPAIRDGVEALENAAAVMGHNILKFDLPAIEKVYPGFALQGKVRDTLVASRLIWPEIGVKDSELRARGRLDLPPKLTGSHSLAAWGYRMGVLKGDFGQQTDWSYWSAEMQSYCEQDVEVTAALVKLILKEDPSRYAMDLEHDFQRIILEMEQTGFPFDVEAAVKLYGDLVQDREEIDASLRLRFPPWWRAVGKHTPKRSMRRFVENEHGTWVKRKGGAARGWYEHVTEGAEIIKVALQEFDPGSPDLVADRLVRVEGWQPTEFTSERWSFGPLEYKPSVSEDALSKIDSEAARLIARRMMLTKRIGQIAEGNNAWLKLEQNGRIHGTVITNGAVTGRCTHRKPNMAQVPASKSEYGKECRALFYAPDGMKLVGVDADGLELVGLAHYLAAYDNGEFAKAVSTGSKADGTDPHTQNQKAAGLETRDQAKTFIYAFIYGAGDWKIGHIVAPNVDDETKVRKGKALKRQFLEGMPALKQLMNKVRQTVDRKGCLPGLDGRRLPIRSKHSALNTLIQSAGAVVMKQATVLFYQMLSDKGYVAGEDFSLVAHVHDEFQTLCRSEIAEDVGVTGKEAIEQAGRTLGLRCPVTGSYDIGSNWSETH